MGGIDLARSRAAAPTCVRCLEAIDRLRLLTIPQARFCSKCSGEMELHRELQAHPERVRRT